MRLKRRRFRFHREDGYWAFHTDHSDLYEYAVEYRTQAYMKRYDNIKKTFFPEETMVGAMSSGYGECSRREDYYKLYHFGEKRGAWYDGIYEDIGSWNYSSLPYTSGLRKYVGSRKNFNMEFVLVYWEHYRNTKFDIVSHADALMKESCGYLSMPIYNYILIESDSGKWRLYARRKWLESFNAGLALINMYNMMKPNFKKIYGFDPEMEV
jgi:hypothetical protein